MIKLIDAQLSDYANIAKLHADNWKRDYRGILSDHYLDNEVYADRLTTWYQRLHQPAENQIITVALSGTDIVGFCCTLLNDDLLFGSLIDNLHVSQSMQKCGIGKLLIKDAAGTIAKKALTRKMYLWVYEANANARRMYEHLGGANFETLTKTGSDGTAARTCRYTWEDVGEII